MSQYLPEFIAFATAHVFTLISPGPDFFMVVRNSTNYSRRTALFTALGISIAELVHVTYTLCGIGILLTRSVHAMSLLKYVGAVYLFYMGISALFASKKTAKPVDLNIESSIDLTPSQAFRIGFLTNVTNVKAAFFTVSIFSLLVSPETPASILILYAAFVSLSTLLWFSCVVMFLTQPQVRSRFYGIRHWIDRTAGVFLLFFGARLAFYDVASQFTASM